MEVEGSSGSSKRTNGMAATEHKAVVHRFSNEGFHFPILVICVVMWAVLIVGSVGDCSKERNCDSKLELKGKVEYHAINCRKHTALLTHFGAVGDGKTSNTKAFRSAIANLSKLASDGGAQLVVPPGKWLTGSFNLTSHFTLFLHKDALILGIQDESEWPDNLLLLPSYGSSKDSNYGRYSSLIFGTNLTDVVITGNNGTIDGQGEYWWAKVHNKEEKVTRPYTRPGMIEIMFSDQVQVSNLTLINSPSWHVHPVYCSNVIIHHITILSPTNSPNTDGINPDSSSNVRIEDCFIVSGDDCVAVKSGLDAYGIKVGMPTKHLVIRRITCISPTSAMIALGSEMSGGIEDVRAEDNTAINTESAVRLKTAIGRGAYIKDIFVKGLKLHTMKYVFWMTGAYSSHLPGFDPKAIPNVTGINFRHVNAENVTYSGELYGIPMNPFTEICISNVNIKVSAEMQIQWKCADVSGFTSNVTPKACALLPEKKDKIDCPFPSNKLPIDSVTMETCSF